MQICLILISIIAIIGTTCFNCKALFCYIAVIFCLGAVIADIVMKKVLHRKFTDMLRMVIMTIALISSVILLLNTGMQTVEKGVLDYSNTMNAFVAALQDEDYKEAISIIEEIEKDYGESNDTIACRTMELIQEENYEEALTEIELMDQKKSKSYYLMKNKIYMGMENDDYLKASFALIEEAANEFPQWFYMQKLAGLAQMQQKNYVSAIYYLSRVYDHNSTDVTVLYQLGVAWFENGNYQKSVDYFNLAAENGANDDIMGEMQWYIDQMNQEG